MSGAGREFVVLMIGYVLSAALMALVVLGAVTA
jgi:hypothetical protein